MYFTYLNLSSVGFLIYQIETWHLFCFLSAVLSLNQPAGALAPTEMRELLVI